MTLSHVGRHDARLWRLLAYPSLGFDCLQSLNQHLTDAEQLNTKSSLSNTFLLTPHNQNDNVAQMAAPKTEFETKLREWQKAKNYTAQQAAAFLGVELSTYRHWLYNGVVPSASKCIDCINQKMKE